MSTLLTLNHNHHQFKQEELLHSITSTRKITNFKIHSRANSLPPVEPVTDSSNRINHRRTRSVITQSIPNHFTPSFNNNNNNNQNNKSRFYFKKNKMSSSTNLNLVEESSSDILRRKRSDLNRSNSSNSIGQMISISPVPSRPSTPSPSSPTKPNRSSSRTELKAPDYWNQQLTQVELNWKRASEGLLINTPSISKESEKIDKSRQRSNSLGDMKSSSVSSGSGKRLRASADTVLLPNLGSVWESFMAEAEVSFELEDEIINISVAEAEENLLAVVRESNHSTILPSSSSSNTTMLNFSITSSSRSNSPFGGIITSSSSSSSQLEIDPFSRPTMFPRGSSSARNSNTSFSLAERRDQVISPLIISGSKSSNSSGRNSRQVSNSSSQSSSSNDEILITPSDPIQYISPFVQLYSHSQPAQSQPQLIEYYPHTLNDVDFKTNDQFSKLSLTSSYPPPFPLCTISNTNTHSDIINLSPYDYSSESSPTSSSSELDSDSGSNNSSTVNSPITDSRLELITSDTSTSTKEEERGGYETDASSLPSSSSSSSSSSSTSSRIKSSQSQEGKQLVRSGGVEVEVELEVKEVNWSLEFERLGAGSRGSWFESTSSSSNLLDFSLSSNSSSRFEVEETGGDDHDAEEDEEEEEEDETIKIAINQQVSEMERKVPELDHQMKIQDQLQWELKLHLSNCQIEMREEYRATEEEERGGDYIIEWGVAI